MSSRWLLIVLAAALSVAAQDGRLTEVSGEVYDMLGKPVVNASVLYRNVENGRTYHFVTDLNGKFHSPVVNGTNEIEITDQPGQPVYSGKKYVPIKEVPDCRRSVRSCGGMAYLSRARVLQLVRNRN